MRFGLGFSPPLVGKNKGATMVMIKIKINALSFIYILPSFMLGCSKCCLCEF